MGSSFLSQWDNARLWCQKEEHRPATLSLRGKHMGILENMPVLMHCARVKLCRITLCMETYANLCTVAPNHMLIKMLFALNKILNQVASATPFSQPSFLTNWSTDGVDVWSQTLSSHRCPNILRTGGLNHINYRFFQKFEKIYIFLCFWKKCLCSPIIWSNIQKNSNIVKYTV